MLQGLDLKISRAQENTYSLLLHMRRSSYLCRVYECVILCAITGQNPASVSCVSGSINSVFLAQSKSQHSLSLSPGCLVFAQALSPPQRLLGLKKLVALVYRWSTGSLWERECYARKPLVKWAGARALCEETAGKISGGAERVAKPLPDFSRKVAKPVE